MILLAEHDEPTLAAKKKRQLAPLKLATSTPKNRVWGFENIPSGRPCVEFDLTWETAIGSVQYTYRNASGRAEWINRDPMTETGGINLYGYVANDPSNAADPMGLCGVFLVRPTDIPETIQSNVLTNNVISGPGYEVRFYDQGCCPEGHIKLVQAFKTGWGYFMGLPLGPALPPQLDGKPDANGLPDASSNGAYSTPGKSYKDSPGTGDGVFRTYTIEVCAVCHCDADNSERIIGCITFTWNNGSQKLGGVSNPMMPHPKPSM